MMKTQQAVLKRLTLVTSALVWCALDLHAQSAPTITTQPASQTNLAGTSVTLSVTVEGTGPFTYQWQFNGTNLPTEIITVAGNGSGTYAGDGGAATSASLNEPFRVALDGHGNLFITDTFNNRIRKVHTNGIISTVAGGGSGSDGGAATNASLSAPCGVSVDGTGNLYIADTGNNRIRRVDTNGTISTVAGNGNRTYAGDGGAATNASMGAPYDVALDASGNLYIADFHNNRVRKVDTNGTISTVAGNGTAGYSGDGGAATNASLYYPLDAALDASGNLYIADQENSRVRRVDTNGIISTVAGNGTVGYFGDGGAATNASLYYPSDVALDAGGNLYIADGLNNRIREVLLAGDPALVLTGVTTNIGGNYNVVITSPYGSVTSAVATLTVVLPPSILVQPASQFVLTGSNATLSVTATGTPPLYFSWYFNATNLVQSGTNASFIVTNMSANNAGQYTVVVANAWSGVTSRVATLAVGFPPSVTTQPASQTNLAGTSVTFSVTVDGTGPFTYQWQFNGTNLPNTIITTVAGNGSATYAGDGGAATNASLNYPYGVALDAAGNLYIGDNINNRIRKVDTNGVITTVAGKTGSGYSGDGGAATNAYLYYPHGVALDASGNLYIVDSSNDRIRQVDTNGIITTMAGNGHRGYSGDGVAATNASLYDPWFVTLDALGELYIADSDNNRIRKVDTTGIISTVAGGGSGGDGGAATNAGLGGPIGVAFDAAGNLYFTEISTARIRKVDTNGIITTVAGNGNQSYSGDGGAATNASMNYPWGVTSDASGNLYIADTSNNRIRKVDTNGVISTVAGNGSGTYAGDGGAATNASLSQPGEVSLDAAGNLYIADTANQRIRKVYLAGYPAFTLTNVGPNNAGNYKVVVTSAYGVTSTVATLTVYVPPVITVQPASQLALPGSDVTLSVEATGDPPLYYSWYYNAINATNLIQSGTNASFIVTNISSANAGPYTVVVTNAHGSVSSQVAILTAELPPTITRQPASQAVVAGTNIVFSVALDWTGPFTYQWQFNGTNFPNSIISTVAGNGTTGYSGDGSAATNAGFRAPRGVALDLAGNLYIADTSYNCIRRVAPNGIITTVAGNGTAGYSGDGGAATSANLYYPWNVALDSSGNLYIADSENNRVRRVDTNGIITTVVGTGIAGYSGDSGVATNALLRNPDGVAVDGAGNLYIADAGNNRIRRVDTNAIISTVAGNGDETYAGDGGAAINASLYFPQAVALDAAGNLYIADGINQRIRKVDPNGMITTVAGKSTAGYSGDGGAATNASLLEPDGVALDAVGNVYIADFGNNRIRRVDPSGIITTVAGKGTGGYSGDGGAATNALLYGPDGLAFDATGNLYIADGINRRIRKVLLYSTYPTLTLLNVSATNAGNYNVVINNAYGSVTSAVAILTVEAPPIITLQPANQTLLAGSSPVFSVVAAGSGTFEYLWYFANTNLLQSGTNASLIVTNIGAANAGQYTVVATNVYGSVTSQVATLTILFPPAVTTQPVSQTVIPGTNVSFSVTAVGTGQFSYQWQFNGTNFPNNIITTVAGNGSGTYGGDGGAATNASVAITWGVTLDAAGKLYIADSGHQRVRKVDTNGIITTVAGNGSGTYAGDGGAATNASLYAPYGVAVDGAGNLYIADTYNSRIRRVDTHGTISTVAGNGNATYAGDRGAATNASLNNPAGAALDARGNLYIADTLNNRIRKVDTNGIISTVAGGGSGGDGGVATNAILHHPWDIAWDSLGNMYIADNSNNRIRIVRTNGIIATVAGGGNGTYTGDGGAATNASLNCPAGIALDAGDNLYIADSQNNRIRRVGANGIITTVAGNGSFGYSGDGGAPTNALLSAPQGVAVDAWGNLYIADTFNSRIRKALTFGYPMLVLPNVSTNNAGNYTVVITSPYGSVTSIVATLTVEVPPSITNGLSNLIVSSGRNASFTVSATGSGPLTYQWQLNGTNIAGATASTLSLTNTPTTSAGVYKVLITGPAGTTSASALLTVGMTLGVVQNGDQVILAWTGLWALQSATSAGGPYADVPGAASPFTNLISAAHQQFFRLRSTATNAVAAIGSSPSGFVVSASGLPGYNYAIETSTNLINWTAIQTNPVPFQFIDVNATNYPVRFYRTVLTK